MDRITAKPGPGAVRSLAAGDDVRPQGALAAALDHGSGRLQQDGEVRRQQVRPHPAEPQQAVALGLDFLAVVEHVGDIPHRGGQLGSQPQLYGDTGLHVATAAAVQHTVNEPRRKVGVHRHRVNVPGKHDPLGPAELGPGNDRVTVAMPSQVRQVR